MQTRPDARRERLIRGEDGWWFLGAGGRAQLRPTDVSPHGELSTEAERALRDLGLFDAKPITAYSLTVLSSTDCNLGCGYCFQNLAQDPTGGSRPPRIARQRLSSQTITDVLTFTGDRMAEAALDKLTIMLFGGEPLLNPRGCVELLARASDYGLTTANMTSNGTLLKPEIARELASLRLRSVQVTFDGDRADHDRIRVRRNGAETFDAILANLVAVSEATNLTWNLLINVSQHNVAGIARLLDRLAGALDPTRCLVSLALVGDVGIGYRNDLRAGGSLLRRFTGWQIQAHELGFRIRKPTAYTPCQACSYRDGRYGAVVNADGTLYSCWETAGKAGWHVGTARTGYLAAVDERWVSCQEQHRRDETADELRAFHDLLDASFLDYLARQGAR